MSNHVIFQDLGTHADYQDIWDYQEKLLQSIVSQKKSNNKTDNYLLLVEHPPVYTLGKSGQLENMLANQGTLDKIGATFVKTNRGGDITFHGPGQIVGYPILNLDLFKTDIHWYMRSLEEVIIKVLSEFGIHGERSSGETGVWLDVGKPYARKICAMGVKASRWVTMHGFALNVNTDLKYFEYIIPCGIKDKTVTSLKRELGKEQNIEQIKDLVKNKFQEVFDVEWDTTLSHHSIKN